MTDDPNDKAYHDLSHWKIDGLPNSHSGALEIGRRAVEAAFDVFRSVDYGHPLTVDQLAEMLAVAIAEWCETAGIPMPVVE